MSSRTEMLVAQFVQNHNDLVNLLQRLSAEDWQEVPAGEQRTVAAIAYHAAKGYRTTLGLAQMFVNRQPLPRFTPDVLNQMNAQEAAEHSNASKEEVLGMLDANCGAVTAGIGDLTDEQLDVADDFFGHQATGQDVVAGLVVGHVHEHAESIRSILQG